MKIHRFYIYFLFLFGIIFIPQQAFSQKENDTLAIAKGEVNQDDLGNVTDKFQEYFFEALKQKAIENYEKAITALKECEKLRPNESVVWFEFGKNYKALKQYREAETYLLKALNDKPEHKDILAELYDVYYLIQNYNRAIEIAKKLSKYNIDYYEDLANLYVLTKQYESALDALDFIDEKQGLSEYRENLRRRIYKDAGDQKGQANYLENKIAKNPENTQNYLNLIYFYSEHNMLTKAYEVAQRLQKINPDAEEAHLALYKMYLQQNNEAQAINSMKIVLKSETIAEDIKQKVLQDFTNFVKDHPVYQDELVQLLGEELNYGQQSNKQLGEYYIGNNNTQAIRSFKKALEENPNDFEVIKKLALLQIEEKQFDEVIKLTEKALALYPTQSILYLLQGVAYNNLKQESKAVNALTAGLDFLIENPKMQLDFYKQLVIAYTALDKVNEAKKYRQEANKLKNSTP